jgi:hypothetical protein
MSTTFILLQIIEYYITAYFFYVFNKNALPVKRTFGIDLEFKL